MDVSIPTQLEDTCRNHADREAWLAQLPDAIRNLKQRWRLSLQTPFDGDEVSCSWVARATRQDGTPAVLKLGMPHIEAEHEIEGLRFWDGDPTVRLLEYDHDLNAMLLERCHPGTVLRSLPEPEQDVIIASMLRRLWRNPGVHHVFRPLSTMLSEWSQEARAEIRRYADPGLLEDGLRLFRDLPSSAPDEVLLATDLHAGNVLRAEREPWLVIDPKPFTGDPAYDATQHLLNCRERLQSDPKGTIRRFAELLEVDHERVRLWTFARLAVESREDGVAAIARGLVP